MFKKSRREEHLYGCYHSWTIDWPGNTRLLAHFLKSGTQALGRWAISIPQYNAETKRALCSVNNSSQTSPAGHNVLSSLPDMTLWCRHRGVLLWSHFGSITFKMIIDEFSQSIQSINSIRVPPPFAELACYQQNNVKWCEAIWHPMGNDFAYS